MSEPKNNGEAPLSDPFIGRPRHGVDAGDDNRRVIIGQPVERNAVIKTAYLGLSTINGQLSSAIEFTDGKAFGGFALEGNPPRAHDWIVNVLLAAGVSDWRELRNRAVRVREFAGRIVAIGHIVDEWWFEPQLEATQAVLQEATTEHIGEK